MTVVAGIVLALAALYAGMTLLNLLLFRPPEATTDDSLPRVSLLIPARNEAERIEAALDAALASHGVELEVLVLDDGSEDDTAARVTQRAETDPRLRLLHGAPLAEGWNGKQYACAQLAEATRHETLVFIDADVRLAPPALAQTCAFMRRHKLDLASGFPRELTRGVGETLLVPMIHVLLLGYLPLAFARVVRHPAFATGCGQLIAVSRTAYDTAGGHAAIKTTMHDGMLLPRRLRASGFKTDIFDASPLAECRMYRGFAEAWAGFSKNATEGMATPVGLPIWTLLLAGGHVAPFLLLPIALMLGAAPAAGLLLIAVAAVWGVRTVLAMRYRQTRVDVLLHPLAVAVMLGLQWRALFRSLRGRTAEWRGRKYSRQ